MSKARLRKNRVSPAGPIRDPPMPEKRKLFFSTSLTMPVKEASLILIAPTMGVQKLARPVAVPGAHINIKQPTGSGHGAIQRAKHRGCVRNGQQNHFACPARRYPMLGHLGHVCAPKVSRIDGERGAVHLPPRDSKKSTRLWGTRGGDHDM